MITMGKGYRFPWLILIQEPNTDEWYPESAQGIKEAVDDSMPHHPAVIFAEV